MSTLTATPEISNNVGLFPVSYKIGNGLPGGAELTLHMLVNTPHEMITGYGELTQPVSPPLDLKSRVEGTFTYMTVMPNESRILVVATGYPNIQWPAHGGVGPVFMPNLELRLVISEDWQSGTANFKYYNDGKWNAVENVPVSIIS